MPLPTAMGHAARSTSLARATEGVAEASRETTVRSAYSRPKHQPTTMPEQTTPAVA